MADNGQVPAVIDAQVVEEGPGGQLVTVASAPPPTLFRTDDPAEVIVRASKVALALKDVLKQQGLTQNIQGKDYVKVEGWQTVGAMLGVTSVCTSTTKLENGWEARVEARTMAGQTIGAAEAECLRDERRWKTADDYALRSMAQTRATSKALRSVLAFVVTLAGYEPTPAEEMDGVARSTPAAAPPAPPPDPLDPERVNGIGRVIGGLNLTYAQIDLILGGCGADALREPSGAGLRERLESLTTAQAARVEAELKRRWSLSHGS